MARTTVQAYQEELELLLLAEIDRLSDDMSNGHLNSLEEYKSLSGRIAGLRSAIELIGDADTIYTEKYR